MAGRSRSPRPDITSVIIRLELLGYEYRGVDYNDGRYIYVTFHPPIVRGNTEANMLGGKDFAEIMERIGEMPILTSDPVAREVEMRNRRKAEPKGGDESNYPATERQVRFLRAIGREAGLTDDEVRAWCQELFGTSEPAQLNRRDASALIEALQRKRNEVE